MPGGLPLSVAVTLLTWAAPVAYVGGGNALTLPAQRHLVSVVHDDGAESLFLALQQDGAGPGLSFFRSDDQGLSWRFAAGIQPDRTHRDTADLLTRGRDVALVYSYEAPTLSGSSRHDVYFQWWRYDAASRALLPSVPVRVFDSLGDSEAYYRAELALDSFGRIWVHAFHLLANGQHSAEIAVSLNDGATFTAMPPLATTSGRGGGRLLSLDGALLFLYDEHGSLGPAWYRTRQDTDPLDAWSAQNQAFPDGIYHGAALSAVKAGPGQFHLVYRAGSGEMLWYRFFDGTSFGPRSLVDDTNDWAVQPAIVLHGADLIIFYNRVRVPDLQYDIYARVLRNGHLEEPVLLDGEAMFKGYPATLEQAPATWPLVPCAFAFTVDANSGGEARVVFGSAGQSTPDGGVPDGGTTDGGTSETLLFADAFDRNENSLGINWNTSGLWYTDGRAISDLDGNDLAYVSGIACLDCRVEASLIGFGVPELGLMARVRPENPWNRYDLVLLSNGNLRIRKHLSGAVQVLGEAPSGVPALGDWARLQLTVQGTAPVSLSASVNGVLKLVTVDSSPGILAQTGHGGLWTTRAGVVFDDFALRSLGTGGTPDAGTPDAGTPDAGTPDAGTPDAGAPDAGAPDAGAPDAGSSLSFDVVVENKSFDFLAVAADGTALARKLGESSTRLYASTDGARTWSLRVTHQSSFSVISTLSDGTLIADVIRGGRHYLSRSGDTGRTWQDVLDIGSCRMLTPHSVADLGGTAYFAEYQTTRPSPPIRLWASTDQGRTWSVRYTFKGHRHAHGVRADASRHALWVLFGDTTPQSGIYRSLDDGYSWTQMLGNQQGDVVDAVVTADGLLFGQDISYLPDLPYIAMLSFSGTYTPLVRLSGPAYSSFGLSTGGYLVGASREPGGDIYPPDEVSAHVLTSADGVSWTDSFQFRRASANDTVRADVYWELPSGEVVLQLINAVNFGPGGKGYQVLRPVRR